MADTTRGARERIAAESIGNIGGARDGCGPGLIRMVRDAIGGRGERKEINMEFNARRASGAVGSDRGGDAGG